MNTVELNNLVHQDPIMKRQFLGVYASDKLPVTVNLKPSFMIINTDPSYKPGEHWVAIHFNVHNEAEYFDSYGFEPLVSDIANFISLQSSNYHINKQQLQSYYSEVCGMYCILYSYYKCRHMQLKDVQNLFSSDLVLNDSIVCEFINKNFNNQHTVCIDRCKYQTCVSFYKKV